MHYFLKYVIVNTTKEKHQKLGGQNYEERREHKRMGRVCMRKGVSDIEQKCENCTHYWSDYMYYYSECEVEEQMTAEEVEYFFDRGKTGCPYFKAKEIKK